jgi:hypothetical protein
MPTAIKIRPKGNTTQRITTMAQRLALFFRASGANRLPMTSTTHAAAPKTDRNSPSWKKSFALISLSFRIPYTVSEVLFRADGSTPGFIETRFIDLDRRGRDILTV